MIESNDIESRIIQARILERRFPQVKTLLDSDEVLLAVSKRRPAYVAGVFCIVIGVLFTWQISVYFLIRFPQRAIPLLLLFASLIWIGFWLAVLARNEYIFVTDSRVVHQKVNMIGRFTKHPRSFILSEITEIRFFKKTYLFRPSKNTTGDILIKRNRNSYLIPTMWEGEILLEILKAELHRLTIVRQSEAYGSR